MALDAGQIILPGNGNVLLAPEDTAPFNPAQFIIGDEASYGTGWESLGHTSRENTVALSKDGGDATQKGSWEQEGIEAIYDPTQWSCSVNALQLGQETFELAFGGGTWNAADQSYDMGNVAPVTRALMVILVQGTKRAGFYMPKASITLGDAPTIDVEEFFEIQLNGQALMSSTLNYRMRWFGVRPYAAPLP